MDINEYFFGKLFKFTKKLTKQQKSPATIDLQSIAKKLEILFEAIAGEAVQITPAKEFVGFYKGHLFLPPAIDVSSEKQQNLDVFKLMAFVHAFAVRNKSAWRPRALISDVCASFPGLINVSNYLLNMNSNDSTSFDVADFMGQAPVFSSPVDDRRKPKNNVPEENEIQSESTQQTLMKDGPNVAEVKEFDQAGENPVEHFFEKVRTVEEYKGGNKRKEIEEDLNDVSDALQEVDLKSVVRSNERTKGLIKTQSIVESQEVSEQKLGTEKRHPDFTYPEWDASKKVYRPDWCSVFNQKHHVESANFVRTGKGQSLKARFQSLFNHFLWQNKQLDGQDLDLVQVVENQVSRKLGGHLSDKLFIKRLNQEKDLQVLVLMDQSLSTESFLGSEMVLDMMRDSLMDFLQAFELAHQQIGIFSFFSETRHHCSVNVIKDFEDSIGEGQSRLKLCKPQGYTRIGVALRHGSHLLSKSKAKKRCLLLLTDSKPTDFDRYEGSYGFADIRKATDETLEQGHEMIVLSYSDLHDESFSNMFPHHVKVFSATTRNQMNQKLLEIVERIVIRK